MDKLIQDHRRLFGDFEAIDFVDENEVVRLREQLDVDVPMSLHWTWEYGSEVAELRALYEKGKVNQWNAETDLDWDQPVSRDEFILEPRASMLAQLCQLMGKDEATQRRGIGEIRGRFIPSGRNELVRGHYSQLGFSELSADGETSHWTLTVEGFEPLETFITADEESGLA